MNKFTVLLLFSCLVSTGQKIDKVDSIAYDALYELTNSKDYKNRFDIKRYKTKSGNWLAIGDTLIIGKPSNQNNISQGSVAIGQGITNHSFIYLGTGAAALTGTFMMGNEGMLNDKAFIIGIVAGRVSKKQEYEVFVELNRVGGGRFVSIKKLARALLEKALESAEIINPNAEMTRSQAITKLKEAKELLDLEMITKEEYNTLKTGLSPIIQGQ